MKLSVLDCLVQFLTRNKVGRQVLQATCAGHHVVRARPRKVAKQFMQRSVFTCMDDADNCCISTPLEIGRQAIQCWPVIPQLLLPCYMPKKREAFHQMLSIENPPPDSPCPCQALVQLKSGGDEIEKPPHKLPLPEVDMLKKLIIIIIISIIIPHSPSSPSGSDPEFYLIW
ncbi:hypothetical protein F3Y22_tig00001120pilonHSYRG00052 [Hibiscus syriacus]|uniref:Uncharacterized protein n=1 Tax=Hibiscus syriacus TaxID=106335 RepID=A0A6A3CV91_HIBSY|nr:hypothetical protein F3Y22_tig00001120pilonHSYRG00052 [Hibiscus syriacus]